MGRLWGRAFINPGGTLIGGHLGDPWGIIDEGGVIDHGMVRVCSGGLKAGGVQGLQRLNQIATRCIAGSGRFF